MNNQHTPGPWTYRDGNIRTWTIAQSADIECRPIAEVPHPDADGYGLENAMANARLIAAVPELVAALARLLGAIEADNINTPTMTVGRSFETNGQAIEQARAAIAKAMGNGE